MASTVLTFVPAFCLYFGMRASPIIPRTKQNLPLGREAGASAYIPCTCYYRPAGPTGQEEGVTWSMARCLEARLLELGEVKKGP